MSCLGGKKIYFASSSLFNSFHLQREDLLGVSLFTTTSTSTSTNHQSSAHTPVSHPSQDSLPHWAPLHSLLADLVDLCRSTAVPLGGPKAAALWWHTPAGQTGFLDALVFRMMAPFCAGEPRPSRRSVSTGGDASYAHGCTEQRRIEYCQIDCKNMATRIVW